MTWERDHAILHREQLLLFHMWCRDGRSAWLSVDNESPVNGTSTSGATTLDTDGMLWIGMMKCNVWN
jgi:Laminin G domain